MFKNRRRHSIILASLSLFAAVGAIALLGCGGKKSEGAIADPNLFGANLPTTQEVDSAPQPLLFEASGGGSEVDLSTDVALPPIGNQSPLPSCTAWATGYATATFEAAKSAGTGSHDVSRQASPADLYVKLLQKEGHACGTGTHPTHAMEILVNVGVPSLSEYPYSGSCQAPSSVSTFRIGGFHVIQPSNAQMIKDQLALGHVIPFGGDTYDDFVNWGYGPARTQVYTGSGRVLAGGGHCMTIVGYSDSRQAWRVMNSWGTDWGDQGFFWMSYQTFARTAAAAYVADGGSVVGPPEDGAVQFSEIRALEYYDYPHLTTYLVMPFKLNQPIYVQTARIRHEESSQSTPWVTINQWGQVNYVWLSLYNQVFLNGHYTLEFQGLDRNGNSVSVSGTALKEIGSQPSVVTIPGVSPRNQDRVRLPKPPSGLKASGPGDRTTLTFNGHRVSG